MNIFARILTFIFVLTISQAGFKECGVPDDVRVTVCRQFCATRFPNSSSSLPSSPLVFFRWMVIGQNDKPALRFCLPTFAC